MVDARKRLEKTLQEIAERHVLADPANAWPAIEERIVGRAKRREDEKRPPEMATDASRYSRDRRRAF